MTRGEPMHDEDNELDRFSRWAESLPREEPEPGLADEVLAGLSKRSVRDRLPNGVIILAAVVVMFMAGPMTLVDAVGLIIYATLYGVVATNLLDKVVLAEA